MSLSCASRDKIWKSHCGQRQRGGNSLPSPC
jgi:hypothetical protein